MVPKAIYLSQIQGYQSTKVKKYKIYTKITSFA